MYANIYNYSPWASPQHLNNGDYNGSSAWVMLVTSSLGYGQIGWIEYAYGERHTFVQWAGPPNGINTDYEDPPQSVGVYTNYTALYNYAGAGVMTFQVNNNTVFNTPVTFSPDDAQISGEINTLSDQMPGNRSFHEDFADSHVYTQGWQTFNGTAFSGDDFQNWANVFLNSVDSSTELHIWDNDCP